jgi:hypothetical protein
MKSRILSLALLAAGVITLAPRHLSAQIPGDVDADIPFKFIVNSTTLGPGKYVIRPASQGSLEIVGSGGHATVFVLTEEAEAKTEPSKTELVFNRHGDQEFLSKIFIEGERDGVALTISPIEKKLDDAGQKHEVHSRPATLRKAAKRTD